MELPFRPPKRSRRSSQYETAELVTTAERPAGGRRKLRVLPLTVRIRESILFLLACIATAFVVGIVAYMLDATSAPWNENSVSIWQAFEASAERFAVAAFAMWLAHLATTLIVGRIHRVRASEGRRTSALAGIIAYPLFLACVAIANTFEGESHTMGIVATALTLIVPGIIATLLAPLVIPAPPPLE
jgi:hypothetical protein